MFVTPLCTSSFEVEVLGCKSGSCSIVCMQILTLWRLIRRLLPPLCWCLSNQSSFGILGLLDMHPLGCLLRICVYLTNDLNFVNLVSLRSRQWKPTSAPSYAGKEKEGSGWCNWAADGNCGDIEASKSAENRDAVFFTRSNASGTCLFGSILTPFMHLWNFQALGWCSASPQHWSHAWYKCECFEMPLAFPPSLSCARFQKHGNVCNICPDNRSMGSNNIF